MKRICRFINYIKNFGVKSIMLKMFYHIYNSEGKDRKFYEIEKLCSEELERQKYITFANIYKISIVVPVYRTPEIFLKEMIDSVRNQSYSNWELCIADGSDDKGRTQQIIRKYSVEDERIKSIKLEKNKGISGNTNEALGMATGDYIGLLDHDDVLAPNALYEVVKELNNYPETDIIYTDEDKMSQDGTQYFEPNYKPDFNLELLRANNYICHFFLVEKEVVKKTKGFQEAYNGAQDYDFIFQCIENSLRIRHIEKILYHWRVHEKSTSSNPESKEYAFHAGLKVIQSHLERCGLNAVVKMTMYQGFYQIEYLPEQYPKVTIINFDNSEKNIRKDINQLEKNTDYQEYEIISVSKEDDFKEYKEIERSKGTYLMFIKQGVYPLRKDWLKKMAGYCVMTKAECVSGKIYDKTNNKIHTTVYRKQKGKLNPLYGGIIRGICGEFHRESLQQEVDACTSECLLISKQLYCRIAASQNNRYILSEKEIDMAKSWGIKVVYYPQAEFYSTRRS